MQVVAIVLEKGKAVGVRYRDVEGREKAVHSRREVIISAGAINSPKLLQISGVGPPNLLNKIGVPVQVAILTARIRDLTSHFETHKSDHHGRRGLLKLVGRRKRLLAYLKQEDNERYQELIASLELRH